MYTSSAAAVGPSPKGGDRRRAERLGRRALRDPVCRRQARGRDPRGAACRPGAAGGDPEPGARPRRRGPWALLDHAGAPVPAPADPRLRRRHAQHRRRPRRRARSRARRRTRTARGALHPRQPQLHLRPPVFRPRAPVWGRVAGGEAAAAGRARPVDRGTASSLVADALAGRIPGIFAELGVCQQQGARASSDGARDRTRSAWRRRSPGTESSTAPRCRPPARANRCRYG